MTAELPERVSLDDFNSIPSRLLEPLAPGADYHDGGRRLALRPLSEVTPRRVRWLVPGLIPLRTLTLVAGVGGLGKSTWLAAIAAKASRGDLLGGQEADVVIVSFEDPAAEVLRPRVEAAGGKPARVHEVVVEGLDGIDPVRLPHDVDELERLVVEVQARLVIVDPIVAAIDTALDAHKDQHVRSVLARLAALAESADCAIALVGHLNKTPSRDAYIRVASSVAFWNASRSVVLVTEDGDAPEDLRLVAQRKANYCQLRPVERHRIEEILLPGTLDPETGEPIVTSRMVFVEVADDVDGADILRPRNGGDESSKERRAAAFLLEALADGDWHDSAGLKPLAGAQGISERTLQRAAGELDVEHERRGFPSSTWWRLASRAAGTPKTLARLPNPHGSTALAPVAPVTQGGIEDGASDEVRGLS